MGGVKWTICDVSAPRQCANEDCPNLPTQGTFQLIETQGSARMVRIWLCAPCASDVIDGPKMRSKLGLDK